MAHRESPAQRNEAFSPDIQAVEKDAARLNAMATAMLAAIESGEMAALDSRVGRTATAFKALAETQLKLIQAQLSAASGRISKALQ